MTAKIRKLLCTILSLSFLFTVGCDSKANVSNATKNGKISVYTSFYTMNDFTNKIGGDKVEITNLVPSGTEPHDWEPGARDIAGIEKADVLIYNGAGMEGWMDKLLRSVNNSKLLTIETAKDINLLDSKDEHSDLKHDPHVWLNPMLAKKQMQAIKDAFVKVDPSNKEYYEKNFNSNVLKLDELDNLYKQTLSKFTKKDIVVSHQAFSYLCEAYGLTQTPIEGVNADSEPTPSKMAEIAEFAKNNEIKVIFFEELLSPKLAQTIAREVGAKTLVLNPLEGLEEDDIKNGKEYFSVMRENLEMLKEALQ